MHVAIIHVIENKLKFHTKRFDTVNSGHGVQDVICSSTEQLERMVLEYRKVYHSEGYLDVHTFEGKPGERLIFFVNPD